MMSTKTTELAVTYFPFTFPDENDLKRLIPYFDTIRLLQVFPDSDPGLPDLLESSKMVQLYSPISDPALLETVRRARKTYDQLGEVHQGVGFAHLLQTFALQEDFETSRTGLVASIRQAHPRLSEEELEFVNDAVFILLAHQFDYEHVELDRQLELIRGQEAKFQEEVGIGIEEENEITVGAPVLPQESDPARTQYAFQRLRAWTRLYCSQEEMASFPALTTSPEVFSEIAERLPSQLAALTGELPETETKPHLLSILPDPKSLSLAEVLEFRQLLNSESICDNWRKSLTDLFNQLEREPLQKITWQDINHHLQEQADGFRRLWPAPGKPRRYLRLECQCYPKMQPEVALALVSGLKLPSEKMYTPAGTNGITLLIHPSEL